MKNHPCHFHKDLMEPKRCHIFVIGQGRTATRSICCAIYLLGFSVRHGFGSCSECSDDALKKYANHQCDLDQYKTCECSGELPGLHWQELAEERPDAKFILTTRPLESWLHSWEKKKKRAGKRIETALNQKLHWLTANIIHRYGMIGYDREVWQNGFVKYNKEVQEYFEGSGRLIVMNPWTTADSDLWIMLATFLDRPIPKLPFPHISRGGRWEMPDGRQITMLLGIPKIRNSSGVKK